MRLEFYHLVTLWKATREERELYEGGVIVRVPRLS